MLIDIPVGKIAPRILQLPNHELLGLYKYSDQQGKLEHLSQGWVIQVSGAFYQDICKLFDGVSRKIPSRLPLLEQKHEWLQGLSAAKPVIEDSFRTLMGHSLGMFFVELTSKCNEKCIHCYADSAPEKNDFLSLAQVQHVLQHARLLGRPCVQFTGGDPLIHKHLLYIVDFAYGLNFEALEIYTNGLLLNQSLLAQLKPYQPKLAFSMYSHLPATHDLITRVKGSHRRTCQAIERAMAEGFDVRVSVIRMRENMSQQDAIYEFLLYELKLEPKQIKFYGSRSIGRGKSQISKEESTSVGEQKYNIKPQSQQQPSVRRGKLCVSATGDIHPCVFSRKVSLGNIHQTTLMEALAAMPKMISEPTSLSHWQACQEELSCGDCQVIAYVLGEQ